MRAQLLLWKLRGEIYAIIEKTHSYVHTGASCAL